MQETMEGEGVQETIFGALFDPEDDRVLSVGDEVWRVTIDVVERLSLIHI